MDFKIVNSFQRLDKENYSNLISDDCRIPIILIHLLIPVTKKNI
jgi:hypothetical protein